MTKVSRFRGTALAKGFETDKDAEQNGVWRVHQDSGIHVRVRRGTLPEHKRALRKHWKPFAHLTTTDPKQELLIKQKAASETLVADWGQSQLDGDGKPVLGDDGQPVRVPLVDADGNEIRPTVENVQEAFVEMPDFFDWVSGEADTFEHYRVRVVEGAKGNSSGSSNGSASGETPKQLPSLSDEPIAESSAALSPGVPS